MSESLVKFEALRDELILTQQATKGNWFGLPAIKIEGRVLAALWENGDLIVKLQGDDHAKALGMEGAVLFQPMPDRNPMKEWVQVPYQHVTLWGDFARAALDYVRSTIQPKHKK